MEGEVDGDAGGAAAVEREGFLGGDTGGFPEVSEIAACGTNGSQVVRPAGDFALEVFLGD